MVALTLDKMAVFYRAQERWADAASATVRSNVIRALFLATGLNQEGALRLLRTKGGRAAVSKSSERARSCVRRARRSAVAD